MPDRLRWPHPAALLPCGARVFVLTRQRARLATRRAGARHGAPPSNEENEHEHRTAPPARAQARPDRPDHHLGDPGRAREHRDRDGLQADAHELLVDHPRVGGFRRGSGRCRGTRPRRIGAVDAAAVGPDPGLHPRHPEDAEGARRRDPPRRRHHAQRRLRRRQPRPGRRLRRAGVRRRPPDRLRRNDGAPSRHRRAVARLLRHRRGDRRLCRGPAVQGDQGLRPRREERDGLADRARQHPRLRPRGRRHGCPGRGRADRRRAHGRAGRALRPRDLRPRLRAR